jgi:hypothetical protein
MAGKSSNTMRAVVCRKIGDPTEAMTESSAIYVNEEQPRPTLSSSSGTSLRVRVVAASVNFATVLTLEGKYQERPKLPFIPGSDYAGIVIEVGRQVTDFNPGDAVCGVVDSGTFAEEIVADVDRTYVGFLAFPLSFPAPISPKKKKMIHSGDSCRKLRNWRSLWFECTLQEQTNVAWKDFQLLKALLVAGTRYQRGLI